MAARGALAVKADASDLDALSTALGTAREQFGSLDAVVNAVSAARPPRAGPFGGGELADADLDAFRGWTVAVAEQAFVFLSAGAAALKDAGGGALIQVTGGSSRRAMPGKGLWAAGAFATRALVQAAAQELRSQGIHVALLAVDATIESPKTAAFTRGQPPESLGDMGQIAEAVAFLVTQRPARVHARAGGHARGRDLGALGAQTRWISVPVPSPPPQHIVTSPISLSERSSSCSSVVISRAPVDPSGCPSAIAPPLTFTRSMSGPSSRRHAATTERERLVDLDQVDVVHRHPVALEQLPRRGDRAGQHDHRVDPDRRLVDDPRAGLQAQRVGLLARHQQHRGGAVGDLRAGAGGDLAVGLERRLELRQRLDRCLGGCPGRLT